MQETYSNWWSKPKAMTKKQIKEMIKNMKIWWIIKEKSDKYHKSEEIEAENILQQLNDK